MNHRRAIKPRVTFICGWPYHRPASWAKQTGNRINFPWERYIMSFHGIFENGRILWTTSIYNNITVILYHFHYAIIGKHLIFQAQLHFFFVLTYANTYAVLSHRILLLSLLEWYPQNIFFIIFKVVIRIYLTIKF